MLMNIPRILLNILFENESLNILNYNKINLFELQDNKNINEIKRKNMIIYYIQL